MCEQGVYVMCACMNRTYRATHRLNFKGREQLFSSLTNSVIILPITTRIGQTYNSFYQTVCCERDMQVNTCTLLYVCTVSCVAHTLGGVDLPVYTDTGTPGTRCLRMHLISEIARKIGYFSNPCNIDVFSRSLVLDIRGGTYIIRTSGPAYLTVKHC